MSELLKYIVKELNKPPFSKNYNLISFDSLEPLHLLQVVTDVLAEIDSKQKVDVREEAADQTAIRILSILRILKYKPPTDAGNLNLFRQGLVQGDKPVIYPILQWLFQRTPELKKRAYLARYLVKLDIPSDFMADEQIDELFQQYERLIDDFKELHREAETLKKSGFNTADIKKDIATMEDEKDQLIRRVDRVKRKVENHPNSGPMLGVARNLRLERDREENLQKQKHEQKNLIVQGEQRIHRLTQQIKDTKQAGIGATPEGLLSKLEEEAKINQYMVKDKLPREVASRKKTVQELHRVVSEPAMGQADLDAINKTIRERNAEVNNLIEKRMMSGNPTDDKLSLFRQQAGIITHKKEAAAEKLRDSRDQLARMQLEVDEKRNVAKQNGGEEVLKGEEFKRYVNQLRGKSTVYKKKRQELAESRAEAGVLSRTEEILKQKDENLNDKLSSIEARQGVSGYRETQEALESISAVKSELDTMKYHTLEDMSILVQRLNKRITEKKNSLSPIIKELRPLRQKSEEMKVEYNEKKSTYDQTMAGLESKRSRLEQEVKAYREEIAADESRFHYLSAMKKVIEIQQQRIADEMKAYVSSDPQEKRRAFREQYSKKIQEQENLGKGLREKQKYVRDNQGPNMQQMKMWKDYQRLMECKMQCTGFGTRDGSSAGKQRMSSAYDEDRLVL